MKIERSIDFQFQFPACAEPAWKHQVEHWNQLDSPSFGLAEFYHQKSAELGAFPDFIILASPSASNSIDRQFASMGGLSPSKFVHTLPNIRISTLCQLMGWNGPVLCIQNGPESESAARQEAHYFLGNPYARIWILSVKDVKVSAFVLEK